jgi:2-dehydro-3-deoxygalactonokinase
MEPMEVSAMNFIACDWGTSRLRLRWHGPEGLREVASEDGAARLAARGGDRALAFREALQAALLRLGAPVGLPVMVSGMASSSIGWRELPYALLPFSLEGSSVVGQWVEPGVYLISGVRGQNDMMRGEETQALGWAEQVCDVLPLQATLVLPGTHSKHLHLESGVLTAITTFMTGELFEMLRTQSMLRHSMDLSAVGEPEGAMHWDAFIEGVAASARAGLAANLFQVRTRQVLRSCSGASNRSFLSGLLIGSELRSLEAGESPIILAAGEALREAYTMAAIECGLSSRWNAIEVDGLAEMGQRRIWRRLAPGQ